MINNKKERTLAARLCELSFLATVNNNTSSLSTLPRRIIIHYQYIEQDAMITNIYAITAIAVLGGTLFGFDLSSMSAMYVHSLFFQLIPAILS